MGRSSHHGGAFVLQWATGLIIGRWTSQAGHYPMIAYQVAFGLILAVQMVALAWFVLPRVRALGLAFFRALGSNSLRVRASHEPITCYQRAAHAWAEQITAVRAGDKLAACGARIDQHLRAARLGERDRGRPRECHALRR
jgi:hypothetical protein